MPLTEHTINDALASLLRTTRHCWRESAVVSSENTGMLRGNSKRPDVLVLEPHASPVVIEVELMPAVAVEAEARARLGQRLRTTGRTIRSAIAARLPARLRGSSASGLHSDIAAARDLEFALFVGDTPSTFERWPSRGWIQGSVSELSVLTQSASIPPAVIEEAANALVQGVEEAGGLLAELESLHPAAVRSIAAQLKQQDGEQTRRMATTILANAFLFHEVLAGGPGGLGAVRSLVVLRGTGALNQAGILEEWNAILRVNYWPIFDIARRLLELVPAGTAQALVDRLAASADRLVQNQLMRSHDLTGAVFQRLIADRKFLAAFYTTPASASLLVGLVLDTERTPRGAAWSDPAGIRLLRVADFACGTGTLLPTIYARIGQLHELAGGDSGALHPEMMASGIVGCDVLPAAAHLTASMLSGAHPTVQYQSSSIWTVAYGTDGNDVALGSLDLLDPQGKLGDWTLGITARVLEAMGESERSTWTSLPHATFDVVLMNPPFTRATGHEGKKIGVPVPIFAAFEMSHEQQRLMSKATQRLLKGTSAHGNAGEASMFLVLADRKLKTGGVLGLVMPLSLMSGDAWEKSRRLLRERYTSLILVSIASLEDRVMSFSADTGMGECLVFGRKSEAGADRAVFVTLDERPQSQVQGAAIARAISSLTKSNTLRRLDDGPLGGTAIRIGDDVCGQAIDAPLAKSGGWNLSRVADFSLAQAAHQMAANGRLWLPRIEEDQAHPLSLARASEIGQIGPYHMDINAKNSDGSIRGPFDIVELRSGQVPTYPVLWAHDADRERQIRFGGDAQGVPKRGGTAAERRDVSDGVAVIANTASHLHFNRDFQFNSQSTALQFTPVPTIGGRAWLSIKCPVVEQEMVLALWGNTSMGLLLHWYFANKQQQGRGNLGKAALASFPLLDVRALTQQRFRAACALFEAFCDRKLTPLNEMADDPARRELDEAFAEQVLGVSPQVYFPALNLIRAKLAAEPSIRGGKDQIEEDVGD